MEESCRDRHHDAAGLLRGSARAQQIAHVAQQADLARPLLELFHPHREPLVGAAQLFFRLLALGDVLQHREDVERHAGPVPHQHDGDVGPEGGAVLGDVLSFGAVGQAVPQGELGEVRGARVRLVGVHERREGTADHLGGGVSPHVQHRPVQGRDTAVETHPDHADLGGVEHRPETLLAFLQGRFRHLALVTPDHVGGPQPVRHVAGDPEHVDAPVVQAHGSAAELEGARAPVACHDVDLPQARIAVGERGPDHLVGLRARVPGDEVRENLPQQLSARVTEHALRHGIDEDDPTGGVLHEHDVRQVVEHRGRGGVHLHGPGGCAGHGRRADQSRSGIRSGVFRHSRSREGGPVPGAGKHLFYTSGSSLHGSAARVGELSVAWPLRPSMYPRSPCPCPPSSTHSTLIARWSRQNCGRLARPSAHARG